MSPNPVVSENRIILLIGAVQFVNILDFMMVMPLGPDFARELAIPNSAIGLVGGSYTAAAALSGVVGALFLDRFDRRSALGVSLLGLVLATAAGGFAVDLPTLLAARVAAGAFGGPATSSALAILADAIPVERRGRAMGAVMSSFSIASVIGVPIGLELARLAGWQTPFFAVAALGLLVTILAITNMPPFTQHLAPRASIPPPNAVGVRSLLRPTILIALSGTVLLMISTFSLVPNLSAYWQLNFGYPRERLGLLYMVGGAVTFVTTRVAGLLSDRFGAARTATLGGALFASIVFVSFVRPLHALPVFVHFTLMMVSNNFRMVPMQALASRVPSNRERARFMSAQSAVQHAASAVGAFISSRLLSAAPSGALIGMDRIGILSIAATLIVPFIAFRVQAAVTLPASVQSSKV